MSESWFKIGKYIENKHRFTVSGYIREFEKEETINGIIPSVIIYRIIFEAYFYTVFPILKRKFFDVYKNNAQQEYTLNEIYQLLKLREKWDPETANIFNGEFSNYIFQILRYSCTKPSFIQTILKVLCIIQNSTESVLLQPLTPSKLFWTLLMKHNSNTQIKSHILYLYGCMIPYSRRMRIFLSHQDVYQFIINETKLIIHFIKNNEIKNLLKYWDNLTYLLQKLVRHHRHRIFRTNLNIILSIISLTLKGLNKLYQLKILNEYHNLNECFYNICILLSMAIASQPDAFFICTTINKFIDDGILDIYIQLIQYPDARIRFYVLDFIVQAFKLLNLNEIFQINAILKTGLINHCVQALLYPTYEVTTKEIVNILVIWKELLFIMTQLTESKSEMSDITKYIQQLLLNENVFNMILQCAQRKERALVIASLEFMLEIFNTDFYQSVTTAVYLHDGQLIDIVCKLFRKIGDNEENIWRIFMIDKYEINSWISLFIQIIILMKKENFRKFIIKKLKEHDIVYILQKMYIFCDDKLTNLTHFNLVQYHDEFLFLTKVFT